ncbi:MAG: hypothetical protein ACTSRR_11760 [Candidatus Heimdallarchaeaceae archaeon]
MNKSKIFGTLLILTMVGLSLTSSSLNSLAYDQLEEANSLRATTVIKPHDIISQDYLNAFSYSSQIRVGKLIKFKVTELERTENIHVQEGDKKIKKGDNIIIRIEADPDLNLNHPDQWALIYVNDVKALYTRESYQIARFFHYILPKTVNISMVDFAQDLDGSMFGDYPIGTEVISFFDFVKYFKETGDPDFQTWEFEGNTAIYEYDQVIETGNTSHTKLIYDMDTSFLNEYYYSEIHTVNGEVVASANMTLIRTHGWGLPYNVSTLVVWIPIMVLTVGVIIAIRLKVAQRIKIYFEAKKLAKREE